MPSSLAYAAAILAFLSLAAPAHAGVWCTDAASCKKFCNGSKADVAAIKKVSKTYVAPSSLAPLSDVSKALGCGARQEKAGACGFYDKQGNGKALKPLIPALINIVKKLKAKNDRYVLIVESASRDVAADMSRFCEMIVQKKGESANRFCGIALACPGDGNSHWDGYALDVYVAAKDKAFDAKGKFTRGAGAFTYPVGMPTHSCAASIKAIRAEKDGHMKTMNEIFFSEGFWRYCWEQWHFELSAAPLNSVRTNCLSNADCKGGKTCKDVKLGSDVVPRCG